MKTYTLTEKVTLTTLDCGVCGIPFAMPTTMYDECQRNHRQNFYCPNGHSLAFHGKTEAEKLRERLKRVESAHTSVRDQLEASERSNAALKGVVTRTKKRVGNGVCPCCSRSFANVARHMANQHPDYAEGTTA